MPIHDWTRVFAGIFHDFHLEWISTIKRALNSGLLPPDYYAMAEQVTGGPAPDVVTLTGPSPGAAPRDPAASPGQSRTLTAAPPKTSLTAAIETGRYARKRRRVIIRHVSDDSVISVVEIVWPGNKASARELRSFARKAAALLHAGVHLLAIDLFPPGRRDPHGIHGAILAQLAEDDYAPPPGRPLTFVSYAADEKVRAFIEPAAAGDPPPEMPVFLEPETYVPLPLAPTYDAAFAAVPARWRGELE